ncbi:chemotaxis protein MotB [Paucidesulfovibrio gracilis DSM 16080]|uniref:Chemotaxis protein MotB n=1 Tax=Paucidesulfovibrio gracilis DSM 16080 TaxID=1121449 RepID=A0A1T4XPN5_9BACT|nr:OmpA family protein [Paucidesulfovibrio gracilis]SKA91081.1 chemotaxis protein MotB [Paucidesulfovibrio gracilis DSM 16080]
MSPRKKKKACPPLALWLVTFSDLVTLLLTFFVLLLTMSSMDQSFITRVTVQPQDAGELNFKGAGRISIALEAVLELIEEPSEAVDKPRRIKDLLYPDQDLPPDVSRSTLNENLRVLERQDGLALVMTDKLLFPEGGSELDDTARQLLDQIIPLLGYANEPVFISGHTDGVEAEGTEGFALSAARAEAVLAYFVRSGLPDERFSLAAYGDTKPLRAGDEPEDRAMNRRIEILIRTTRAIGSYS